MNPMPLIGRRTLGRDFRPSLTATAEQATLAATQTAARRYVAGRARNADDARMLLDCLGLLP